MRQALLASIVLCTSAFAERVSMSGMPLDFQQWLVSKDGAQADPIAEPAGILQLALDEQRTKAFHSRIEAEGKIAVPDLAHFERMKSGLVRIANNSTEALVALGHGWRIRHVAERHYEDTYLDSPAYDLALAGLGMRKRTVNGEKLELNVKPGLFRTGPGGIITIRPELGLDLGPNADLRALALSPSQWNPITPLTHTVGGDPQALVDPSLDQRAQRARMVLERYRGLDHEGKEYWEPLVDLSADNVYEMRSARARKSGSGEPFYGLEADLNHPGTESGLIVAGIRWTPPHTLRDASRPEFLRDPAVLELHQVFPRLMTHLAQNDGIHYEAALPKNTEAAIRLGLIRRENVPLAHLAGVRPSVTRNRR